ncbi:MAG: hypothetical protein U9Q75_04730, partial [Pseudomonadota bacterium]|nr:hypothetical protein [Pseudomonadota bacterium]
MRRRVIQIFSLLLVGVLLNACEQKPKSAPEVSEVFWQAVIMDETDDVLAYSTLQSIESYDRFDREWRDMVTTWGKIVIDGDVAQIDTEISKPGEEPTDVLYFVTYLVNTDEGWRVDYQRTAEAVNVSGAVVDFVGQLTSLGKNIQRQVEASSESAARQIAAFVGQLEQMSGDYQNQMGKAIDDAAGRMQRLLDEFARSLQEAVDELQEPGDEAGKSGNTEASRSDIKESVEALQSSSDALKNPTIDSIASAGRQLILVTEKLARLSDQKLQHYT